MANCLLQVFEASTQFLIAYLLYINIWAGKTTKLDDDEEVLESYRRDIYCKKSTYETMIGV